MLEKCHRYQTLKGHCTIASDNAPRNFVQDNYIKIEQKHPQFKTQFKCLYVGNMKFNFPVAIKNSFRYITYIWGDASLDVIIRWFV